MTKDLQVGKLSTIMPAEARIALPEVVSVFICKYETELYDNKATLSDTIINLKKEKELIENTALDSGDFSAFIGIKQTKLKIISFQSGDVNLDWEEGTISTTIGFHNLDDKGQEVVRYERSTGFEKVFSLKLATSFMKAFKKCKADLQETNAELQHVIAQLNDMPRKARQVTARISEMRLEEQGLSGFLNDATMQKLISTS